MAIYNLFNDLYPFQKDDLLDHLSFDQMKANPAVNKDVRELSHNLKEQCFAIFLQSFQGCVRKCEIKDWNGKGAISQVK